MILRQIAHPFPHTRIAGRFAEECGVATRFADDAEQNFDQRTFAGAVLAEQSVDLAGANRHRDALERLNVAVRFRKLIRFDDRRTSAHATLPRCR